MSDTTWFTQTRYGMFVHWGPYSVAARGEWVMNRERIPLDEYMATYAAGFTADRYDPAAWAALAREAGMGYVVLTTRHHDGYALWDTATTPRHAGRLGAGRDLVRPFVEAVRAAGLKVGLYFSVADWSHPDYPAPHARDWPRQWRDDESRQRFIAYYRAQLDELMTRYGKIDLLWYDGCIPGPLEGEATNRRIYEQQPGILINERNGAPFDFRCSEQSLKAKDGAWESCLTLNNNWGYHQGDQDWKGPRDVIRSLVQVAGKGGNLLLNVGPRADGTIPEESVRILRAAGAWLARNRAWLPDSGRSPFGWNNECVPTVKGNRLYLHFFNRARTEVCYAELANPVRAVHALDGGAPIAFEKRGPRLFLKNLPDPRQDGLAWTVVVECEGEPTPATEQTTHWIPD